MDDVLGRKVVLKPNECWLRFVYAGVVSGVNIDRNDGAYPMPHWAGQFVLLVDDADSEWPSDREGRVKWH